MAKYFILIALPFLTISCKEGTYKKVEENTFRIYSKNVSDMFTISVNLPNNYEKQDLEKYPVVYLLDANLYFDIVATTLNKYSDVGLAPSVILVGIGYKDFRTMDSLRTRDDTYPTANPEYEMSVSGGADKFLSFINNELVPKIDKEYKTDTSQRILIGHSLGGYFTCYTFLQDLLGKHSSFSSYIAASPSIHYNKYYLLSQLKRVSFQKNKQKKINIYITYGGEEDAENRGDSSVINLKNLANQLSNLIAIKQSDYVIYKSDIYSNLGHMDTQMPTFIKGLRWALSEKIILKP